MREIEESRLLDEHVPEHAANACLTATCARTLVEPFPQVRIHTQPPKNKPFHPKINTRCTTATRPSLSAARPPSLQSLPCKIQYSTTPGPTAFLRTRCIPTRLASRTTHRLHGGRGCVSGWLCRTLASLLHLLHAHGHKTGAVTRTRTTSSSNPPLACSYRPHRHTHAHAAPAGSPRIQPISEITHQPAATTAYHARNTASPHETGPHWPGPPHPPLDLLPGTERPDSGPLANTTNTQTRMHRTMTAVAAKTPAKRLHRAANGGGVENHRDGGVVDGLGSSAGGGGCFLSRVGCLLRLSFSS